MKKIIISLFLTVSFVCAIAFSGNAASYVQNGDLRTPTAMTYKDFTRLEEVATEVRGMQATVVNATRYNGRSDVWMVRISYGEGGKNYSEDYAITVCPFGKSATGTVNTLPFKDVEDGTKKFGKGWYYFGLFDTNTYEICGYAIAERVKRWPEWLDLSFNGRTFSGVQYTGNYPEASVLTFLTDHLNKQ